MKKELKWLNDNDFIVRLCNSDGEWRIIVTAGTSYKIPSEHSRTAGWRRSFKTAEIALDKAYVWAKFIVKWNEEYRK